MKKRWFAFVGSLIGLVLLSGCQKMKDDIAQLKEPIPTGIVLLTSEVQVQNGTSVQIPFRVNPSNYVPTLEQLSLDVISSQITRVAYGTSIPEYTLVDIQPAKNSQGEVLDGQWVAIVEATEGAYYGEARLALVLNYTDAQGETVQMTSTSVALLNSYVKLTSTSVALNGPSACTYLNTSTSLPISTSTQLVALPISEGSSTLFDLTTVSVVSAQLSGPKADQFTLQTDESGQKWSVSANSSALEFGEGEQYVPVTLTVTLRDLISGEEVPITKTIRFYQTAYTAPAVEYKLSEWPADNRQRIDMGAYLAEVGVTAELFTRYSEQDYLPTIFRPTFSVMDATGQTNASSKYRASFSLLNYVADDPGEESISNVVIAPETDYLQQRFYAKPVEGSYLVQVKLQYSRVESIVSSNPQPTIQATITIPVNILP